MSEPEEAQKSDSEKLEQSIARSDVVVIDPLKPQFNPIEFWVILYALSSGVTLLIEQNQPIQVPELFRFLWRTLLIGGSVVVLHGMFWRGSFVTAHAIQQIGYIALSFGCAVYGLRSGDFMIMAFAPLGIWRVVQIQKKIASVYPQLTTARKITHIFSRDKDLPS